MITLPQRLILILLAYILMGGAQFTIGDAIGWAGVITIFGLMFALIFFLIQRAQRRNGSIADSLIMDRIADLDAKIKGMEKKHAQEKEAMEKRHSAEMAEIRGERDELKRQAVENAELRRELEEKKVIAPTPHPQQLNVLGVWSQVAGIDPKGNAQSLELAGVKYNGLFGDKASMEYILYELRRDSYSAIEVGGPGNADAIQLADGMATADWWSEVADIHKISMFLFLSDNSTGTNQISIADAVFQVPTVRAVISVQGPVPDTVARKFSKLLYANLGAGATLAGAMREARLAVTPEYKKLFVLREKEGNKGQ